MLVAAPLNSNRLQKQDVCQLASARPCVMASLPVPTGSCCCLRNSSWQAETQWRNI